MIIQQQKLHLVPSGRRRRTELRMLLIVAAALLAQVSTSEALLQVPNRHTVASIPGELVLGILVPVHERPSPKQAQTRTCGAVREQYGIQRVEAAFRTIDSINADRNILPNITLGIEIRDSCWHSPIALEQSIEFIRDAMAASEQSQVRAPPSSSSQVSAAAAAAASAVQSQQQQPQQSSATPPEVNFSATAMCASLVRQQQQQQQQQLPKKVKNIVGVVGPASSGDTVQVQNLLQLFNMPQVGYSATSRDLSNKNFFKYFLRVVPSDTLQAQVMIDLMLAYNWTYVTLAYTEGSYGSSLMNAFRERAQEVGICFATVESMPPNADDSKFDELIEAIQKHPNARVVICMCEGRTLGKLFSGFKRKNIINEYLVVGSDGWSDRFDVVEKHEEFALGGISIRIHSSYVEDFDDYYFALSPFANHRNPWFAEFWETRFQCNLEMGAAAANSSLMQQQQQQQQRPATASQQRPAFVRPPGSKVYNRTCTGRESLRNNHKQDAKMAFVQKSIITMALALDSMQRAICPPGKLGLCPEMLPVNGSILLQHLMNVSFSFLNEEVHFDEQGDPPGKYEILNFQRSRRLQNNNSNSNNNSSSSSSSSASSSAANSWQGSSPSGQDMIDSAPSDLLTTVPGPTQIDPSNASDFDIRQRKRLENPLYDSYSTLKVYRRKLASDGSEESSMSLSSSSGSRLRRRRRRRHPQMMSEQHLPASGYSSTSGYEYVHVGSWKSSDGLSIFGNVHWPRRSSGDTFEFDELGVATAGRYPQLSMSPAPNSIPKSVCSLPCARGHAKKIQSDSVKCCWVCVACRPHEYLFDEFKCKACEKGWWPNGQQTGCDQIPIHYLDWRSMEALTAISIASTGLILTLITAIVFIRHNNTPVVKSSTRELSYMILFAMFLSYLATFLLVAKPTKLTCLQTRILPGFAFAMMYGALVTKTNRIARILAGSKKKIITRRPRFMSGTSQVAITWLIVLIECVIIVFMLIREPADKTHEYPSADRVLLVCNTTTMGIIAPLGFDFFLILMCTLYAFKTRNVPENFNEAKFIGFTMYTTLVIWIAFVVIYLSSEHRVTTLSLCISFSSLFALFLLFFPRCYIIIFKPEKNNRSFFTTTKNVRCHIGYQIATSQSSAALSNSYSQPQQPHQQQTGNGPGNSPAAHQQQQDNLGFFQQQQQQPISSSATGYSLDDSQQLQVNGAGQPQAARTRTSALQWHHYQQQQPPSACEGGGWPTSGASRKQQQAEQQLKRSQSWLMPTNYTSSVAAAAAVPAEHQTRPADRGRGSGAQPPPGGSVEQPSGLVEEPAAGAPGRGPSSFLCSLVWSAFSLVGWRARRKESDKASSIQQHLRAIRHAENLDRQTHFRRSQVQRLVQRFDSSGTQFVEQQQLLLQSAWQLRQAGPSMGAGAGAKATTTMLPIAAEFSGWPRGEDAERLLAVLGQLIGGQNVWRLVDTLRRHQGGQQSAGETRCELVLVAPPPSDDLQADRQHQLQQQLDLCKLSDRRLALALLKFLAELARKAISEIQIADEQQTGLVAQSTAGEQSIELLQVAQDRDEIVDPDDSSTAAAAAAARRLCKIEPPSLSQRHWSQKQQKLKLQQIDKAAVGGDNSLARAQQRPDDNQEIMSRSFVDGRPQKQKQQHQQRADRDATTSGEDDPIRRTLECIMGTKGSPCCPRPTDTGTGTETETEKGGQHQQMNGPTNYGSASHSTGPIRHPLAEAAAARTATSDRRDNNFHPAAACHRGCDHTEVPPASPSASAPASIGPTKGNSTGGGGLSSTAAASARRELKGHQVIGQSINGDTKTNHRNSGSNRESRARCCCERRQSSRSRCCSSSSSSATRSCQPAACSPGQRGSDTVGEEPGCHCCSRSVRRAARRQHHRTSRSSSGGSRSRTGTKL